MVGGGEVGHRVGDEEGLHALHERDQGGGQAADVGVDAGQDDLVAAGVEGALPQVRAVERAVAPLGEDGLAGRRGELGDDRGAGVVAQPAAPEVGEQAAVGGILLRRLRGVDDRHPGPSGGEDDAADALHGEVDLGRRIAVERGDEVPLHVVHQDGRPPRVEQPAGHVVAQTDVGSHRVRLDGGQHRQSYPY